MVIAFIMNPPSKRKRVKRKSKRKEVPVARVKRRNPAGRPKRSSKRGVAWRKLVKKYGVTGAAKRWKRLKRKPAYAGAKPRRVKRKTAKKRTVKRRVKRKTAKKRTVKRRVAANPVSRKRSLAAKKAWRTRKRREGMAKRRKPRRKNPKGRPKTSKGRAWRALVKKHGVQKAAKRWRKTHKVKRAAPKRRRKAVAKRRKRYASNEWSGQKRHHRVAAMVGWAKRKGISVPAYLRSKGVSERAISGYVKGHGAVGSHRRYSTKTHPVRTWRGKYAANPAGIVKEVKGMAMQTLSLEGMKNAAAVVGGIVGSMVGGKAAEKFSKKPGVAVNTAGSVGASILIGVGITMLTKDRMRGTLAATAGVGYTLIKLAYNKFAAGKVIPVLDIEMPALAEFSMGDYVELPAGMSDYVELPAGSEMSQFLPYDDVSQFLPAEEVGIGDGRYAEGEEDWIEY